MKIITSCLFLALGLLLFAGTASAQTSAPFWELIGGYEGDTHGSSYAFFGPGYVHPVKPRLAVTARVFGTYLAYSFNDSVGETKVRSPGVSPAIGLRFGGTNSFTITAGPEVKWRRTEVFGNTGALIREEKRTRYGGNFGAEVYANPTTRNNVQGGLNYNTTDKYTWGRLGFKQQVSNLNSQGPTTISVGFEGIGQGNRDIRSVQGGGLVEVAHAKASVMFRAGYKQSMFDVGPNKTGLYFGVGYYQRLN
jgi:hypothetical protein